MIENPEQTARAFVAAINAENLNAIHSFLTEDHVFVDARGNRFLGAEKMVLGWQHFFHAYPHYRIIVAHGFANDNHVALFGEASGSWRVNGVVLTQEWRTTAAWLAEVEAGKIKSWAVFCDTSWATPPKETQSTHTS